MATEANVKTEKLVGTYLLGQCRSGFDLTGPLIHAVGGWVALCGKEPGRRSAGWQLYPDMVKPLSEVTCTRCKSKLAKMEFAA